MADDRRGGVRAFFDGVLDVGAAAWLCIYPIACALLAFTVFTLVPQGRELLRILIERGGDMRGISALTLYYASSAWLALGVWYAARVLLTRRFPAPTRLNGRSDAMRLCRVHLPWLVAIPVLTPVALISVLTGEAWYYSALGIAVTLGVLGVILSPRRPLPRDVTRRRRISIAPRERRSGAPGLSARLPRFTRNVIVLWGIATWCLLAAFSLSPVTLPRWFGGATIVQLALLGWAIFGSFVLVLLPKSYGWPSLAVIVPLLLAVASSWTNDNHAPREAVETASPTDVERELRRPVAEYFDRWIAARNLANRSYPIFIVSAEGGGLRAAYWTASVLGRLQDKWPGPDRFSDHVFAISGVSGGGLGASVFAALVAAADRGFDVETPRAGCSTGYAEIARCVLNDDFLSPTLASMLFANMAQQFFPFPIHWADRARSLEQSWEASWRAIVGTDTFAAQAEELWRAPGATAFVTDYRVPALLINGTIVEDGRRIVFSNFDVTSDFIDAYDGSAPVASIARRGSDPVRTVARIPPLPLSTFVHMGARFTYISPAARLERSEADCRGCLWGRVVDGGYHDNSGAETALDVLQALAPLMARYRTSRNLTIVPYVILITNDPTEPPVVPEITGNADGGDAPVKPAGRRLLPEPLSPVDTLFSARESRSPYARSVLARLARRLNALPDGTLPDDFHAFEFFLDRRTSDPALGWVLSRRTDLSMDLALGAGRNQDNVTEITALGKQ